MAGLHLLLQAGHRPLERRPLRRYSWFCSRACSTAAHSRLGWFFCLVAAAFGTYLLPFTQTLNNHTVAAWSAFFALYRSCASGTMANVPAGDSRW